jgi:peptidyl-prolyl cis-trans isomerase D
MPALDRIRSGIDSAGTRVFIGVVFVAFIAFFGGMGRDSSGNSRVVATVNGEPLDRQAWEQAYRRAMQRQNAQSLSEEEEQEFRSAVLDDLIRQTVILQEADRLGVVASTKDVALRIQADTDFHDDKGAFDTRKYEKALRQVGYTPQDYESEIMRQIRLQRVVALASASVVVSEGDVRRAWEGAETEVSLTVVRMPTTAFLPQIAVSDAERDDYVAKNGDALKKSYDAAYEREYNLPRTYETDVLLLRTELPGMDAAGKDATKKKAEALRAQAVGGADFANLARQFSEDLSASKGGDLGSLAQGQLDPVRVKAADAAGAGKVSEVYETGRGYEFMRVRTIRDARVIPFEEARNDLAVRALREMRVADVAREHGKKIVAAWTDPAAPPRELTEPLKLSVSETGSFSLGARTIPQVGASPGLILALKSVKAGQVLPEVYDAGGSYVVAAVTARTEPDPSKFAEGSKMVRATLEAQRAQQFLSDWSQALVARASVDRPQ